MLHIQPNFQNPSETIPSLPEEFQKENENKKPQVFRYWDLANQEALPGLGQRMQWSLPPLTALRMNTNDSIKHCITLDTEEGSEAVPSPCPVVANTRAENSSQICYRSLSKTVNVFTTKGTDSPTFRRRKSTRTGLSPLTFPKHYLPANS